MALLIDGRGGRKLEKIARARQATEQTPPLRSVATPRNPWMILTTLSLGFFMTLLDLTIVNIAIPSMLDELQASLDEVLWVLNGYILVLAVLLITSGRLGDLYGPRTMFLLGVVIFTAASVLCGLSPNPAALIAARALQGLGAALLMPQTMAIIVVTFPPERRGPALGIWGAVAGLATVAGPTVGGFLVTAFDWRWIFFVNLPVGVAVLAMAYLIIPDIRREERHRIDVPGVLLATAALLCLIFALTEGQRYGWGVIWSFVSIPLLLVAAAVLFAVFLAHQWNRQFLESRGHGGRHAGPGPPRMRRGGRHARPSGPRHRRPGEPLAPFTLFSDRNYVLMNFVSATVSIGLIGTVLPITIYLQSVLGMSALTAGLTLAPTSVVAMGVSPLAGRLSDRIGGRYILMAGLTCYGAGMIWFTAIATVHSRWQDFMPCMIVAGVGQGCMFAPLVTEALRNVDPRLAGAASGVLNTVRQLGAVLGSASVGALMQNRLAVTLTDEAARRSTSVPAEYRASFTEGFSAAARHGIEVGAGQIGAALRLPDHVPAVVARQVRQTAEGVFGHGFVTAMRPTLALPIVVLLTGAVACLAIKGPTRK
jgi:MFS family permease